MWILKITIKSKFSDNFKSHMSFRKGERMVYCITYLNKYLGKYITSPWVNVPKLNLFF